jgi:hypothetical protein
MANSVDHKRPARNPWNIGFGAVVLLAALAVLLLWIPNDIRGKFLETNISGKVEPGDAFFPVLLAGLLLILGAVMLLASLIDRTPYDPDTSGGKLTPANLRFLGLFSAVVLAGLALMYWLGPLITALLRALGIIDQSYRQLLDTVPYKYLGYLVGGFLMTVGLIARAEGKVRLRSIFIVIAVLASSVVIIDILLINVQLPPNADY